MYKVKYLKLFILYNYKIKKLKSQAGIHIIVFPVNSAAYFNRF